MLLMSEHPVDRQADDATIKKAYKKLAKKYHPDKNKDEGAQAKFADVSHGPSLRLAQTPSACRSRGEADRYLPHPLSTAYEVLMDTEVRARFETSARELGRARVSS